MPVRGRAPVAVEEGLGCDGIVGDDPGRQPGRLLVGDSERIVDSVDERDRHRRDSVRIAGPLMAERPIERERSLDVAAHLETSRRKELEEPRHELLRLAVDEGEVEPVADAEPVEAVLGESDGTLAGGGGVDIEHATTFGVGQCPDPALGCETGERSGRLAAPAENHERNPFRQRNQSPCALPVARADEPDGSGRQARRLEGRTQDLVDEDGHGSECGCAGPQHRRIEALQELACDVECHVGTSLEVGTHRPDGNAPLGDLETVLERPRAGVSLEWIDFRHRLDLPRKALDSLLVQPQPVERSLVEPTRRGRHIGCVRCEYRHRALARESRRAAERLRDGVVAQEARGSVGLGGLVLDLIANRHPRLILSAAVGFVATATARVAGTLVRVTPVAGSLLDLIGSTPLVELKRMAPHESVRLYAKLEGQNPTGSIKDRIALAMIDAAEASGELEPGRRLLEPTSGNTGISLALVARIRGYHLTCVMPANVTEERRRLLRLYGAEIVDSPSEEGSNGAVRLALELSERDGSYFMPFQYANEANPRAHYEGTGAEIAAELDRVDVLVAGLGTGGTLMGVGKRLRETFPDVVVAAAEPLPGDPVMGLRSLEDGYVPPILDVSKLDRKLLVSNEDAVAGLRALLEREGIFGGVSSGAVVHAAERVAAELDEGVVVCVLADGGWKYLSADFWETDDVETAMERSVWW